MKSYTSTRIKISADLLMGCGMALLILEMVARSSVPLSTGTPTSSDICLTVALSIYIADWLARAKY